MAIGLQQFFMWLGTLKSTRSCHPVSMESRHNMSLLRIPCKEVKNVRDPAIIEDEATKDRELIMYSGHVLATTQESVKMLGNS